MSNDPRSLPDWIEQGYEILVEEAKTQGDPLTRERAEALLVGHGDFPDESEDAGYVIDRLLNSGWLYEVNDELRITDPEN